MDICGAIYYNKREENVKKEIYLWIFLMNTPNTPSA